MILTRPTFRAAVLLAALVCLAGCGRRGPLEPPSGAADANAPLTGAPDQYGLPKNTETAPIDAAAVASPPADSQGKPLEAPKRAPRPFPLDPLL